MLNIAYCSDKYQYTMGKSFYDSGMKDKTAIFNMFYRKAPENNNWAVVSGIDEVVEMIQNLKGIQSVQGHQPPCQRIRVKKGTWAMGSHLRGKGGNHCRMQQYIQHTDRCDVRLRLDRHNGPQLCDLFRMLS